MICVYNSQRDEKLHTVAASPSYTIEPQQERRGPLMFCDYEIVADLASKSSEAMACHGAALCPENMLA